MTKHKINRSRDNRVIADVLGELLTILIGCTLVRIIFVALVTHPFCLGILVYIIAWVLIPMNHVRLLLFRWFQERCHT